MKTISRITSKEQYLHQIIYLMECGNQHQFEMDGLFKKNCKTFYQKDDYGRIVPVDTIAVCPECGDDSTDIEQLNIAC